jgi:3-hydroxyisobutyrate dehydrogenase-like beta-hydroxyacid dehydrogenase
MNVGVVGLGSLGVPMARNLVAAGLTVRVHDIRAEAYAVLEDVAVVRCASVAELAVPCEVVISVVWDDAALHEVAFGPSGLLAGRFRGCFVDLSTTSVAIAREIGRVFAAAGATFLDGAVIGGGAPAAQAGKSPIVIAGDRDAATRITPVLRHLGSCDYVGSLGCAKVVKIVNNLLVGVLSAANAEAASLGVSAGIELATLVDVLRKGPAASTALGYLASFVERARYGDGLIGHRLMAKDLALACELADETRRPAVLAAAAQQTYMACAAALGPASQFPAVYDAYRGLMKQRAAPA